MATTLPLLRRHGAVWHRFGRDGWHTLDQALASPDGDRLLAAPRPRRPGPPGAGGRGARAASAGLQSLLGAVPGRAVGEREQAGPWGDDGPCAGCRQADADWEAREAAGREQTAVQAVAAEQARTSSWWRRS
ncbi:hypothetical protein ACIGXM_31605 [Kitasatospora sp. NPDC052896]|uniref:hypothetical protein n=1 Tax=Kitasatospora sp. NPDC052896 TaxID=3364061 RepID=UPI0037CA3577